MDTKTAEIFPRGLGKCIKDLREFLGFSQTRLAELAGISRTVVADLEREKHMPHISNVFKICDVLGITPAELFAYSLPNWKINKNIKERGELHKSLRKAMYKTLSR